MTSSANIKIDVVWEESDRGAIRQLVERHYNLLDALQKVQYLLKNQCGSYSVRHAYLVKITDKPVELITYDKILKLIDNVNNLIETDKEIDKDGK